MIRRLVQFLQGGRPQIEDRGPATRVTLGALNSISFEWTEVSPARTVVAANISSTGIGLLTPDLQGMGQDGSVVNGILKIQEKSFSVKIEIIHRNGQISGCRFVNPDFQLPLAIQNFLEAELVSSGLKPISPDLIATRPGEQCHWYRDKLGNELFAVQKDSHFLEAQLVMMGTYVEYDANHDTVHYGVISDELSSGEITDYVRSDFDVRFIKNRPPELGNLIQKFIASIQGLDADTKTQLFNCFQKGLQ
jgi:hypothetical protein